MMSGKLYFSLFLPGVVSIYRHVAFHPAVSESLRQVTAYPQAPEPERLCYHLLLEVPNQNSIQWQARARSTDTRRCCLLDFFWGRNVLTSVASVQNVQQQTSVEVHPKISPNNSRTEAAPQRALGAPRSRSSDPRAHVVAARCGLDVDVQKNASV